MKIIKRNKQPNPGSLKAIKLSCSCPPMDNNHGAGFMGMKNTFWVQADCPLHGTKARAIRNRKQKG